MILVHLSNNYKSNALQYITYRASLSGSAGLRAAIDAHDAGTNVLIISKSKRGDPHTTLARGGINAALGTDGSRKQLDYTCS